MGARDERKVTPGITELSRLRVHRKEELQNDTKNVLLPELIDGAGCYIDVGSTYPGSAEV